MEFELQKWKKVIIHELRTEELESFLLMIRISTPPGGIAKPFRWCDGWIIVSDPFPLSREILKEQMEGILRWRYLGLAQMPEFSKIIQLDGGIKVPVIDVSDNPFWVELIAWAKANTVDEKT